MHLMIEKRDEGLLTQYHGILEMDLGPEAEPDMSRHPLFEWTSKISMRGNRDDVSDLEPYLTEYDLMRPEDMPHWCARAWMDRHRLMIRTGEIKGKVASKMIRRIERIEARILKEKEQFRKDRELAEDIEREWGMK